MQRNVKEWVSSNSSSKLMGISEMDVSRLSRRWSSPFIDQTPATTRRRAGAYVLLHVGQFVCGAAVGCCRCCNRVAPMRLWQCSNIILSAISYKEADPQNKSCIIIMTKMTRWRCRGATNRHVAAINALSMLSMLSMQGQAIGGTALPVEICA